MQALGVMVSLLGISLLVALLAGEERRTAVEIAVGTFVLLVALLALVGLGVLIAGAVK